ncbi:MAG: hypothetical protein MUC36_20640, partial [Planctomycetes bacterium]|nr:hypothetical protein [Planctomycetota bacterium]
MTCEAEDLIARPMQQSSPPLIPRLFGGTEMTAVDGAGGGSAAQDRPSRSCSAARRSRSSIAEAEIMARAGSPSSPMCMMNSICSSAPCLRAPTADVRGRAAVPQSGVDIFGSRTRPADRRSMAELLRPLLVLLSWYATLVNRRLVMEN